MNNFQIYNQKYAKISLHKNGNMKLKSKNFPPGLKNIFITNSNGLEISSQIGNFYHYSKKNILDENNNIRHITHNNSNNKNLSFPINSSSIKQNINYKYKDNSLMNQKHNLLKQKFETCINKSKKDENSNNFISKENTNSNINIMNKGNLKINIIPKKSNLKFINYKDNNISINSNINLGKSISKSKSKSKSKNKRENKSTNNKMNNNINKMIFDKYLKLYKIGEKVFTKKTKNKNTNYCSKESPNYNISKYSNEANNSDIQKMNSFITNKGLRKKNKSSNLLTNNINQQKNMHNSRTNSNIIITKIENNNNNNNINNNTKLKNIKNDNKLDNNENNINNNKEYLTQNHIMYINKRNTGIQKRKSENNKDKHTSLKDLKNENFKKTNTNNNSSNNYLNNYFIDKKHTKENSENIIYDYKTNNIYSKKYKYNNNINSKNNILNDAIENSDNAYKNLNERLKTEYYENSLEAIDKMYEEENNEELNQKSMSFSKQDSFRFLYPEIYIKDDEYFAENNNNSDDKKEKELDETESPLKMDTDKITNENSGVLSFDQVKDIICYYNMNNTDKQSDFLFQKNERQIYDIQCKNKYLNFFFPNYKINDIDKNNNNTNNDLIEDMLSINTNTNLKYPNSSIFSLDTEYSSKMKKKYNKNLVKNI